MKIINIRFLACLFACLTIILLLPCTLIFARNKNSTKVSREQRIEQLEKRLSDLEGRAILSDPEFIIKKKVIWVCKNGHQHDSKLDGKCPFDNLPLKKSFTYQREKVFRRQTIGEQIAAAQSEQDSKGIKIGISGTTMFQTPFRLKGRNSDINGDFFGMGSMDIFFISRPALYTMFFADVEVIGGLSPDNQIANISFLNSDGVRLALDKTLNLREGWMRTELFGQNLIVVVGMLDLTNYFDLNTAANDETSQFITDALVNNLL
ncbi:MAG TPA: carbohydrate porin, partial [Spirochaetes bacterium]|nr:carbohydrate porin [Spirochaetota bacterium]